MKTSKSIIGLVILIMLIAINVPAQRDEKDHKAGKQCTATASQIYFVDSGSQVTEMHPGSNGGNGYQLNIIGDGENNFEVIQERYMTALYFISVYTNPPQAKWGMTFAANRGRMITGIKMKNKCTGETREYRLTVKVRLLDQ